MSILANALARLNIAGPYDVVYLLVGTFAFWYLFKELGTPGESRKMRHALTFVLSAAFVWFSRVPQLTFITFLAILVVIPMSIYRYRRHDIDTKTIPLFMTQLFAYIICVVLLAWLLLLRYGIDPMTLLQYVRILLQSRSGST
jgi:hypothetical protein